MAKLEMGQQNDDRAEPVLSGTFNPPPAGAQVTVSSATGAAPTAQKPVVSVQRAGAGAKSGVGSGGGSGGGGGGLKIGGGMKMKPPPLPVNSPSKKVGMPWPFLVVWVVAFMLCIFITWATFFELAEVSTGTGKVVPSSREKVIQSLEGGILVELMVKEGDVVAPGQVLAQLDRTKSEATVQESVVRQRAAQATAARLVAEVTGAPLKFPEDVVVDQDLVRTETALYTSRRDALSGTLNGLSEALSLVRKELSLTEPLVKRGAASDVEVLRLKRQANDLETRMAEARSQYLVKAREDLSKANAEIESLRQVTRGRADALTRLTFTSPARGIVKDISVTTVGGVIPPNGRLMEIVPLDEKLLVEARISPRDVAFIHPGQAATVKITAYDYSIYGGLPATW